MNTHYDTHRGKIYDNGNDYQYTLIPGESSYCTANQFNSIYKVSNQALSLFNLNCQSLKRKFENLKDFLNDLKLNFKILALTETWIKNSDIEKVQIDGYNMFYSNREDKRGGGVAMYVDKNLKCKIDEQRTMMSELMEILTIEIMNDMGKNILISCVYRPPGPGVDQFTDKIIELFANVTKSIIVCGDFNIDIGNDTATNNFKNYMEIAGLCPTITKPTRITSHSATTIDNIYSNLHGEVTSGIFETDISDHLPIFLIYEKLNLDYLEETCTITKRDKSKKATDAFREVLKRQNWSEVYNKDINIAYNNFISIFSRLYDQTCKITTIQAHGEKNIRNNPWMTKGLKNACKKKNYLYRSFLKLRTKDAESRYKKYKNKLVSIIRKQKQEYYTKLLQENKNNTKNTWGVINSVLHKGKTKVTIPNYFTKNSVDIFGTGKIVNEFNQYFANIGSSLSCTIPHVNLSYSNISDNLNSIFLDNIQPSEILTIVQKFTNKQSSDYTDMNMHLIKQIIDVILEPLTYICNLSFSVGKFPDHMKIAKVIPLFKKGNKNHLSNYRPISLLPQFSKILEKLFVNRLNKFLNKYNILSNHQYGFRSNHSTATAIMELAEEITTAMDKHHYFVSIFVDLQKAFDTIDHQILLQKLYKYGIRGVAHKWVQSYLEERNQFVEINNIKSESCRVACGVPQGSVLGPVLFLLYVNDIVSVSNVLKCILFADDTTLFYSGENLSDVLQTIQDEFQKIMNWFNANRLSLNLSKTNFMIFSSKKIDIDATLSIHGSKIERTHEIMFLGVIFDEQLTWKSHIEYVKTKVSQTIGIIHKTKDSLNRRALVLLYNSLVLPYLTYCIEAWGNACKTYTEPIFLLQKRAIRVVNRSAYRAHTNPIFKQLEALKFYELVEYNILKTMFKANQNILPFNLQNRFKKRVSTYELRGTEIFSKSDFKYKPKERCISIQGVNLWNNLQDIIKKSKSICTFKKRLKASLLKRYDTVL